MKMLLLEIPSTLGCHESAPRLPERNETRINMIAEERVLADADSFAGWLSMHCAGSKVDPFGYIPRDPARRMQFIEALSIAQLAAGLLHVTIAFDCANELRKRYLADASTQAYLARVAALVVANGEDL